MLKKILKILGIVIALMIIGFILVVSEAGEDLPENTDLIIEEVMNGELPEFVTGRTGFAYNSGVKIWFESVEPKDQIKGNILLTMGIANDALAWPPEFINSLVDNGYRVIRYDHRGSGMSDWIEDWSKENAYSLSDMSDDGIAVLDALNIQDAHFIGVSMGGMIAQQTAIDHPYRVKTLISIMSSGDILDPDLPEINMTVITDFVFLYLKYGLWGNDEKTIKMMLSSRYILMGDSIYPIDIKNTAQQIYYNIKRRNGYNNKVSRQHNEAVFLSENRYDGLKQLQIPALIIHGTSDPFISIEHGKKCAQLIPYADTMWVKGMGHDIPNHYNDRIIEKIVGFLGKE